MRIPEGPARLTCLPDPVDPAAPTAAELGVDLTYFRFDTPTGMCEHGATLTGLIAIVEPIPWDPTRVRETGRSTEPLTYCLFCHQIVDTQED